MAPQGYGMNKFVWPVRIYYEDTDDGGVVYHSNYLKFFERARTEWLRSLGYDQVELREENDVLFVVRGIQIKYLLPARFNQLLDVVTQISQLGRCRIVFEQKLQLGDEILTAATVEVASVSATSFRPVPIPESMRQQFESQQS
jgi:acyl-CoA thioester hydrolase